MNENMETAVKCFKERILTPILYMLEYEDKVDFICFCDQNIKLKELNEVSGKLTDILGVPAEVIDIREFSESDRIEILKNAKLVYAEDPIIEQVFVASMAEDFNNSINKKREMLNRYMSTGSIYLQ